MMRYGPPLLCALFLAGCADVEPASTQPVLKTVVETLPATQPAVEKFEIDAAPWQRIRIVDADPVRVDLIVRPAASPADEQFIGFEITNTSIEHIELDHATQYRADYRIDGAGGRSGSLITGNRYDLLHRDVVEPNTTQPPLTPGVSRRVGYSSGLAMAALGLPTQTAKVEGRLHMTLAYADHKRGTRPVITTAPEGVPFSFEWTLPDERGIQRMRARLQALVRDPDNRSSQMSPLIAMLNVPALAEAVTIDDVLAGLRSRGQVNRDPVVELMNRRFADAPAIRDAYVDAITRGERWWLWDLARESNRVRDSRLIDPLTRRLNDPNEREFEMLLRALAQQAPLADDLRAIQAAMSKAVLSRSRWLSSGKLPSADEAQSLTHEIELLRLANDPASAALLMPYLGSTHMTFHPKMIAVVTNREPLRLCDDAYNAIVALRTAGGVVDTPAFKPFNEPRHAGFAAAPKSNLTDEELFRARDPEIARLRRALMTAPK